MRVWFILCLALTAANPAASQECRHAGLIRAITGYGVTVDAELVARDLARATYLHMHYADLAGEEIEVMLDRGAVLGTSGEHLRAIYDLTQVGGLAEWRLDAPDVLDRFRAASPALLRALILADEGRSFLALRSAALADDQPLIEPFFAGPRPALYLSDQADWYRERFAARAEDAGAIWLAGAVLSGHSEPDVFDGFLDRNAEVLDDTPEGLRRRFVPYSAAIRTTYIEDQTEGSQLIFAQENRIREAALTTYPISFLGIYHTQSGGREATYQAAQSVLDAAATWRLSHPERYWLLAYETLIENEEPAEVRAILARFDFGIERSWHPHADALWHLDVIVAKAALLPYLRGEVEEAPAAPAATEVDWDVLIEVADHLRQNALKSAFTLSPTATVELLWAQEKYALAWGLARGNGDHVDLGKLSIDLATRLDMMCDQRTILPALEGRWGREQMFYFP